MAKERGQSDIGKRELVPDHVLAEHGREQTPECTTRLRKGWS
jgi:hypothetical protein